MRVKEWKGSVVFLHEVAEGAAGRSWGVHVAELAGVPAPVVRRAAPCSRRWRNSAGAADAPLAALPLFAAARSRERYAAADADPLRRGAGGDRSGPADAAGGARRALSAESAAAGFRRDSGSTIAAMLTPVPLPQAADARRAGPGGRARRPGRRTGAPVPRDAALGAFRRHLARIQAHVQRRVRAGPDHRPAGGAPARRADRRADRRAATSTPSDAGVGEPERLSGRRDRRLWPRRAGAVQRHRPAVPDRRTSRAGRRCRSSSSCCISSGISG